MKVESNGRVIAAAAAGGFSAAASPHRRIAELLADL
jgi:hypothetical protein